MAVSITKPGTAFGRYCKSVIVARGDPMAALGYASGQAWASTPQVVEGLKAAVSPATADGEGWANDLAPAVAFDFCEVLRSATLIGKMAGFVRVPFNLRLLSVASGLTAQWRGEAKPIPAAAMDFNETSLQWASVACIVPFTNELARSSHPGIEGVITADAVKAMAAAIDLAFADPTNAGSAGVRPASVFYGATLIPSTGATVDKIDADLRDAVEALGDSDLSTAYWCMSPHTAVFLATVRNGDGGPAYPTVTAKGGTLCGIPVVVSSAIAQDADSPGETHIGLVVAGDVLLADDSGAAIEYSDQASLQFVTDPTEAAASQVSLWQNSLAAIRASRTINWARRRSTAAVAITGVTF